MVFSFLPVPSPLQAAAVVLVLQLVDLTQAVLLLGTLCSAGTGATGCTATLLFFPFASVIAPIDPPK